MEDIHMHWAEHYWGMHALWWGFWIIMVAVLLYWGSRDRTTKEDGALEELRRRYAAGEIDDAEYDHRMGVLSSGPPRTNPPRASARSETGSGGDAA